MSATNVVRSSCFHRQQVPSSTSSPEIDGSKQPSLNHIIIHSPSFSLPDDTNVVHRDACVEEKVHCNSSNSKLITAQKMSSSAHNKDVESRDSLQVIRSVDDLPTRRSAHQRLGSFFPPRVPLAKGDYGYEKIKDIGTGSFGKAVLVKEKGDNGKLFVMKVIETGLLGPKERRDAINEVQVLSSLKHPYIISYKESFLDEGRLCIVMDYADGGDLYRTISIQKKKNSKGFPEEQILRWFTQATLALKYLHDKHILHRDLKSQNMFLMANGRLRVGDFGIAKVLDGTVAFTKTQIGTPYYLSPEICKSKPYSWASDIWSLGCILYELATLRVPFDAPNISVLIDKITRHPAPPLPDHYSLGLRRLYSDCMQREWQKRPSASDILLRDIIQNEIRRMLLEEQERRRLPYSASQDSVGTIAPNSSNTKLSLPDSGRLNSKNSSNSSNQSSNPPKTSSKPNSSTQHHNIRGQSADDVSSYCHNQQHALTRHHGHPRVPINGDTEVPTPPPLHTQPELECPKKSPNTIAQKSRLPPLQTRPKAFLAIHGPDKSNRSVSPRPRLGSDADSKSSSLQKSTASDGHAKRLSHLPPYRSSSVSIGSQSTVAESHHRNIARCQLSKISSSGSRESVESYSYHIPIYNENDDNDVRISYPKFHYKASAYQVPIGSTTNSQTSNNENPQDANVVSFPEEQTHETNSNDHGDHDVWERFERRLQESPSLKKRPDRPLKGTTRGLTHTKGLLKHTSTSSKGFKGRRGVNSGVTSNAVTIRVNSRQHLASQNSNSRPTATSSSSLPSSSAPCVSKPPAVGFHWMKRFQKRKFAPPLYFQQNNDQEVVV